MNKDNKNFEIALVYLEEIDNEYLTEIVTAEKINDHYKITSIPFFAKNIAIGDLISAEMEDDILYFYDIIRSSGHSTIRILIKDNLAEEVIIDQLIQKGCRVFKYRDKPLLAVDVSPTVDYAQIKTILDSGEIQNKWEYQEACLGWK